MLSYKERNSYEPKCKKAIEAFFFVEGCNSQGLLGKMCTTPS